MLLRKLKKKKVETSYYSELWTQFKFPQNFHFIQLFVKLMKNYLKEDLHFLIIGSSFLSSSYFSLHNQPFQMKRILLSRLLSLSWELLCSKQNMAGQLHAVLHSGQKTTFCLVLAGVINGPKDSVSEDQRELWGQGGLAGAEVRRLSPLEEVIGSFVSQCSEVGKSWIREGQRENWRKEIYRNSVNF